MSEYNSLKEVLREEGTQRICEAGGFMHLSKRVREWQMTEVVKRQQTRLECGKQPQRTNAHIAVQQKNQYTPSSCSRSTEALKESRLAM